MTSIFNKITSNDYKELLDIINLSKEEKIILYNDYRNQHILKEKLYKIWEEGLKNNNPSYFVYDDIAYMDEAFDCWKTYSRKYIKNFAKYLKDVNNLYTTELKKINCILDLGCGIGYSTVALSEVFKNSRIIGTQLSSSKQFEVCKYLEAQYKNISFVSSEQNTTLNEKIDVIFASEFFEHFEYPINLLIELINAYNPKYFICANSGNIFLLYC